MSNITSDFTIKETDPVFNLRGPLPPKPPRKNNPFQNKEHKDKWDLLVSMAHQLQADASKYPEKYEIRFNKLYSKYEFLAIEAGPMFEQALMGKLYEGPTGKIVKAYVDGKGDPSKTMGNLDDYLTDVVAPGVEKAKSIQSAQSISARLEQQSKDIAEQLANLEYDD